MSDVGEGLGRLSVAEMGVAIVATRRMEDYGLGGEMRSALGHDFYPQDVKSSIERPALIAFNAYHEAALENPEYERAEGVDRVGRALRIAIVNERDNGMNGMEDASDVIRAHAILKSVAIVEAMEFPDMFEPSSPMIGNIFGRLGIELDQVKGQDASRISVGMMDLVEDADLARGLREALKLERVEETSLGRHLQVMADAIPRIADPVTEKAPLSVGVATSALRMSADQGIS